MEEISKEIKKNVILGTGTFSTAYAGYIEKEPVCIKVSSKKKMREKKIDFEHEKNILQKLDSPYIIKLFDFYENDLNTYQILESGEKDLFSLLGRKNEEVILNWIKDISKGLIHLHSKNIMHRDIKAENILLVKGKIKIIDFGFAIQFEEGEIFYRMLGTPIYVSPEMLKGEYDYKIDIWSLGILYYELINGHPPFDGKNEHKIRKEILEFNIHFNSIFSSNSKENILKILKINPENRASLKQILSFE
jgi:calcium-dependent protein kinase